MKDFKVKNKYFLIIIAFCLILIGCKESTITLHDIKHNYSIFDSNKVKITGTLRCTNNCSTCNILYDSTYVNSNGDTTSKIVSYIIPKPHFAYDDCNDYFNIDVIDTSVDTGSNFIGTVFFSENNLTFYGFDDWKMNADPSSSDTCFMSMAKNDSTSFSIMHTYDSSTYNLITVKIDDVDTSVLYFLNNGVKCSEKKLYHAPKQPKKNEDSLAIPKFSHNAVKIYSGDPLIEETNVMITVRGYNAKRTLNKEEGDKEETGVVLGGVDGDIKGDDKLQIIILDSLYQAPTAMYYDFDGGHTVNTDLVKAQFGLIMNQAMVFVDSVELINIDDDISVSDLNDNGVIDAFFTQRVDKPDSIYQDEMTAILKQTRNFEDDETGCFEDSKSAHFYVNIRYHAKFKGPFMSSQDTLMKFIRVDDARNLTLYHEDSTNNYPFTIASFTDSTLPIVRGYCLSVIPPADGDTATGTLVMVGSIDDVSKGLPYDSAMTPENNYTVYTGAESLSGVTFKSCAFYPLNPHYTTEVHEHLHQYVNGGLYHTGVDTSEMSGLPFDIDNIMFGNALKRSENKLRKRKIEVDKFGAIIDQEQWDEMRDKANGF